MLDHSDPESGEKWVSLAGENCQKVILDQLVRLSSSDDVEFSVTYKAISKSMVIKHLINDIGLGDDEEPIPIPKISSSTLRKVIEWCEYHANDSALAFPEEVKTEFNRTGRVHICRWKREFNNIDLEMVFDIIRAADFLDIKGLLDAGCQTVANLIKDKTPEEMREIFHVENDFTPEEEEASRKWLESDSESDSDGEC